MEQKIDLTKKTKKELDAELKEQKLKKEHGKISVYLTTMKLHRYKNKLKKHERLVLKYKNLYEGLALAVTAGFINPKKYHEHLNIITKKSKEHSTMPDIISKTNTNKGESNGNN